MQILYLPLEFGRWYSAKKLSYSVGVGMIEGFSSDIKQLTIPLMYHEDIWLKYIKELVGGGKFDQVWLEVVHSVIPEDILEWLASRAPIRVGFIVESLSIAQEEFTDNPVGTQRRIDNLNQKLPYLTHAIVGDCRDVGRLSIPTMLYNTSIPERLVKKPYSTDGKPIFYGTPYGIRAEWINILGDRLNTNPISGEDRSILPHLFEQLFATSDYLVENYSAFYRDWYYIRQSLYALWINHLHTLDSCALINLPHRTEVASGRIIENMASGKPVVSPLLNNELSSSFEDGKNILYYKDIDGLIECIDKLQKDPDLRFNLAEAARLNLLENHTTEVQVRQILEFIG